MQVGYGDLVPSHPLSCDLARPCSISGMVLGWCLVRNNLQDVDYCRFLWTYILNLYSLRIYIYLYNHQWSYPHMIHDNIKWHKTGPEGTILPPAKHFPGNFQAHMGKPQVHMVRNVNRTFNMGNRKPKGLDMFGPLFSWVSNFQQKSFLAICLMYLCHMFSFGWALTEHRQTPPACGWGMFFSFAILVALVLLATRLSHWALTEHDLEVTCLMLPHV